MSPTPSPRVVVGAAVVRGGLLLVAHRARAPVGWELPGGKVEAGESPEAALRREVTEELGCEVRVTGWLEGESPVRDDLVLRVASAELTVGEPVASEHDELRWVGAGELEALDWLDPDRPFLPGLRRLLGHPHG